MEGISQIVTRHFPPFFETGLCADLVLPVEGVLNVSLNVDRHREDFFSVSKIGFFSSSDLSKNRV